MNYEEPALELVATDDVTSSQLLIKATMERN